MSSYENYDRSAHAYDQTRVPAGLEIVTGCLSQSPVPLAQQSLLDAGCGTANYSHALIDIVRRITAVDANATMLARARSKFSAQQQNRVEFHQSVIERLPFNSQQFDGIMINQVLHHLDEDPQSGYPTTCAVLAECARVLKPDGVIVINICSHEQLAQGFWYGELIPDQVSRMQQRHVPLAVLERLLERSGFAYGGRIVPLDALMQGEEYFNARGPLDAVWRSGDSIWSTVPARQMQKIKQRLTELDQTGELDRFVQRCDLARAGVGQMTFVHARRK